MSKPHQGRDIQVVFDSLLQKRIEQFKDELFVEKMVDYFVNEASMIRY